MNISFIFKGSQNKKDCCDIQIIEVNEEENNCCENNKETCCSDNENN